MKKIKSKKAAQSLKNVNQNQPKTLNEIWLAAFRGVDVFAADRTGAKK